ADGGTVVATRGEAPYAAYLFTADTRTGAVRQEIPISVSGETRVAVSGDGSRVAYADTDVTGGDIRVAGATTLDRPAATMTTPRVVDLSMSADGTLLGALVELGTGHTRAARRHADGSDDWTIVSRTADG